MPDPAIRGPNHVLSRQPNEELSLWSSLVVPNCLAQFKTDATLHQHVVRRGRCVYSRNRQAQVNMSGVLGSRLTLLTTAHNLMHSLDPSVATHP
jgi:hypothetical protein